MQAVSNRHLGLSLFKGAQKPHESQGITGPIGVKKSKIVPLGSLKTGQEGSAIAAVLGMDQKPDFWKTLRKFPGPIL
jgi:hypothetical protein